MDLQKYISKISNKMRMTRGESGEMEQSSRFIRLAMRKKRCLSLRRESCGFESQLIPLYSLYRRFPLILQCETLVACRV